MRRTTGEAQGADSRAAFAPQTCARDFARRGFGSLDGQLGSLVVSARPSRRRSVPRRSAGVVVL